MTEPWDAKVEALFGWVRSSYERLSGKEAGKEKSSSDGKATDMVFKGFVCLVFVLQFCEIIFLVKWEGLTKKHASP